MSKWLSRLGLFLVVAITIVVVGIWATSKSLPQGKSGPEADALARKVEAAVRKDAWNKIHVIQWNYSNRQQHLWDRKRSLAQVVWKKGEYKALFPIAKPEAGQAFWRGTWIQDAKKRKHSLHRAFAYWVNDSFWLNPLVKLFDTGTTRKIVTWEGKPQLLVTHASGGVTPGDSYLYVLNEQFLPLRWHLWVKVLPIKGLSATFESWMTLPHGAKISTQHRILSRHIKLFDIRTADTVEQLLGHDPFLPMLSGKTPSQKQPTSTSSTSRPTPRIVAPAVPTRRLP